MTLTPENLFWLLLAAAGLSSLFTLLVIWVAVHFWIGPQLERRIDDRMQKGADALEERIRGRFLELLGGKSREVIRERARDLARTGMGIFAGRRSTGDDVDDEDGFPR